MGKYQYLFTPFKIGTMTVPNRIVMNAHVHRFHPPMTPPNGRLLHYYQARAKGGAGLLITWNTAGPTTTTGGYMAVFDDGAIPAFASFVKAMHDCGTPVVAQLFHGGNFGRSRIPGGATFSSSPIARKGILPGEVPHEMDIDEIKQMVTNHADVAYRMRQAGYDGVEIGAVWGVLLASFMSPAYNERSDEYGGSLENRLRFPLEVIDTVRASVGDDFVVGIKIDGDEYIDGGLTLDDMKVIAAKLEATGKLDYISVSAGVMPPPHVPPMYFPLGPFVYLAAGIKEVVTLPVFAGGRINDPLQAERVLMDNQADMVTMTRALIADPELPNKARAGQEELIRKCIACNDACWPPLFEFAAPLACAVNPEAGREQVLPIKPATDRKNVMVIGGGAAGLETARVATLRGHKVVLYEKDDKLGGQLNIAVKAPGRVDFEEVIRYYTNQMKALNVEIHLGTTVTKELVKEKNPDAVVVATGSVSVIPASLVIDGGNVVDAREVLQEKVEVGRNVVVIDEEHHAQGLSVADFLADKGAKVEVLTSAIYAGTHLDECTLEIIYTRLLTKGVVITGLTRVKEIRGDTVTTFNVLTNVERQIKGVDTVVVATNGGANDILYHSLKGEVKALYIAGQCLAPRKLRDSIWDGARVGRAL